MKQTQQIALLIPLTVGLCALAATIAIHALFLNVAIRLSIGREGSGVRARAFGWTFQAEG